jgi:fatty acid desaturase
LSIGWWVSKHSAHHAHPNEIGRDPDIEVVAPLALDQEAPGRFNVSRFLTRRQAPLFFPLMLLRSTGLHVLGTRQLLRRQDRSTATELVLVSLHAIFYLSIILWVLGPLKALAFIAVQQGVFSLYLGCSFAPNHKGMPVIPEGAAMAFAVRQVVTARNVTGGRITTLIFGGLNYQIEHHLFPAMPRPNLRRAQRLVRAFCASNDLEYCEERVVGSFLIILRHLESLGALSALPAVLAV